MLLDAHYPNGILNATKGALKMRLLIIILFTCNSHAEVLWCSKDVFGKQVVCTSNKLSCESQRKRYNGKECEQQLKTPLKFKTR